MAERHRRRFDRAVASRLTGSEDKVIAVQGSALRTLRRARELGAEAVLDATLAHPGFIRGLIGQEEMASGRPAVDLGIEVLPRGFTELRIEEIEVADRVLVPSSFARQTHVQEGVDPARIAVVPLGVDTEVFSPPPTSEGGSAHRSPSLRVGGEPNAVPPAPGHRDRDRVRLLFVGRLSRLKGLPYLVDAFSQAGIPNAELLLVGDSTFADPAWLRAPGIRHRPPIPRNALTSVFRGADIFVMPSLAESYGLVILEAMASGLPVVVSANSIGPDVVEDGISGYVVPARDSDALADRLLELARNPDLRARMGMAATSSAKRFTWSTYETALLAALSN